MIPWRLDAGQIEVVNHLVGQVLRDKQPWEGLAMAFTANRTMRLRIEGALRTQHPQWSDEKIRREVAQ